ncbi:hypothetical protein NQU36_26510, partial [Escherichia coli]|uniref:hypothetical protein n=1 Tax=Escherichia coli TaxID=562 RepID=UPI0021198EF5
FADLENTRGNSYDSWAATARPRAGKAHHQVSGSVSQALTLVVNCDAELNINNLLLRPFVLVKIQRTPLRK